MKRSLLFAVNSCRCVARHCLGSATGMVVGSNDEFCIYPDGIFDDVVSGFCVCLIS